MGCHEAAHTLRVYQTKGKDYAERKRLDSLFTIEAEGSPRTLIVIDGGEIAILQGKRAARLTAGLAWELRQVLTEYMEKGRFTVGGGE